MRSRIGPVRRTINIRPSDWIFIPARVKYTATLLPSTCCGFLAFLCINTFCPGIISDCITKRKRRKQNEIARSRQRQSSGRRNDSVKSIRADLIGHKQPDALREASPGSGGTEEEICRAAGECAPAGAEGCPGAGWKPSPRTSLDSMIMIKASGSISRTAFRIRYICLLLQAHMITSFSSRE